MAADVHRRGHGRSLEGLSVVAGAAHLLPPDAAAKNNTQAALLRATYQQYVGVSSTSGESAPGQVPYRLHKVDSYGPKLVQGDYTYTTSRKSLMLSSQCVGGGSMPASTTSAAAAASRGTIPAMVPTNATTINTAAWKAYGSPIARGHPRPPLAPAPSHPNGAPQTPLSTASRLPRVGGFKPRRPQSAPGSAVNMGPQGPDLSSVIAAIASSGSFTAGRRGGATMVDVGILAVETPDPIRAGKTDSGKMMFEHTLPTDPYSKFVWEEQARKARSNMSRHVAAMAAAAAVNGGSAFSGGGGGGGGSRPSSARRSVTTPLGASPTAVGAGGSGGGGSVVGSSLAMRPRFSSSTIADVIRQGTDHKPPTVIGFAAPDMTEEATMPGPGDPRWAYTRLGRTQIERLQTTLKIVAPPRLVARPSSAPSLGGGGGGTGTMGSPERSWGAREDGAGALPTVSEQEAIDGSGRSQAELEAQQSSTAGMARTASGAGGGTRPSSAGVARPVSAGFTRSGSAGLTRASSSGLPRPISAGVPRPGSAGAGGMLGVTLGVTAALMAEGSGVPASGVRGSSAGRTREAAPNPRVDLRAYLAEAEADEEDEEGTEMLAVGEIPEVGYYYGGAGGAGMMVDGSMLSAEALQSMPVPPDQLAARLAEMVAAVAVVAAQQQMGDEEEEEEREAEGGPEEGEGGAVKHVRIAQVYDGEDEPGQPAAQRERMPEEEQQSPAAPPPPAHAAPPHRRLGTGDDALLALHGSSHFGRGTGRLGERMHEYANPAAEADSEASGAEDGDEKPAWIQAHEPLGLGLGLGTRGGGRGRPASARPMSARPTSARPGSAMPVRGRSSSPMEGEGAAVDVRMDGGMAVIMEQSEGAAGDDY